jgi:hypothetical protein
MNLALARLQHNPINSYLNGPPPITSMSTIYDNLKKTFLCTNQWRFSMKTQLLNRLNVDSDYPDYQYVYQIPSDCLQIIRVSIGPNQSIKYFDRLGDKIYCNFQQDVYLLYTWNCTEDMFPPYFDTALSLQLAASCAFLFTEQTDIKRDVQQDADNAYIIACSVDSSQHPPLDQVSYPSIDVRNYP